MIFDEFKEFCDMKGIRYTESYMNGELGLWGFDKEGNEIVVKVNEFPDDEVIEQFNEELDEEMGKAIIDMRYKNGKVNLDNIREALK